MAPKIPLVLNTPPAGTGGPVLVAAVDNVFGYLSSIRKRMPKDGLTRLVCEYYSDEDIL